MCRKLTYLSLILVLGLVLTSVATAAKKPHLIGWWKFDGDTLDYSGLDNHGTAFGNPTFVAGTVGSGALDFDGDDYVTVDGVVDDFTDDDVTMAAWIKTTTTGEGDWFSMNPVSGNQYLLCILSGDIRFWEGGWQPAAGVTVNDGAWHHVVATREDMYVKIYVDGVYRSAGSYTSTVTFGTGNRWSIAQEWDGSTPSDFYTGTVDDVRLYDVALSEAQAEDLFNGIAPTFVKAEDPKPADGAIILDVWVTLEWSPGDFAVSHDVYLGENFADVDAGTGDAFRGNTGDLLYFIAGFTGYPYPDGLVPGTTYYWRIDEVNDLHQDSPWKGDVWSFTVPSKTAYGPDPPDGAKFVDPNVELSWTAGFGAGLHTVYFGDDFDTVNNATGGAGLPFTTYTPGTLEPDKTYYWRVDETDDVLATHRGDLWSFTTLPDIPISDPNLVGWWKLDEGSGTTALDWSGYDNHATFVGDPEWVDGIIDGALELSGNDFVRMDSVADDIPSNDMSMGAWVKFTSAGEEGILCVNTGGGGNVILMEHDGPQIGMWESSYEVWSGVALDDGEWHHVMYTRSGSVGSLYTDGVLRGTHTAEFTLSSSDRWSIGQEWDSGGPSEFLVGTVDDARVYKKVLTQAEIIEVMRGDPTLAWNASPTSGSVPDIEEATPLSWSAGDKAAQHDVYFGTGKDAVDNADTSTPEIYRGRQTAANYTPPEGVEWGGGPYYWRIDEYNTDATVSKGRIWSFTVADFILVDDFEGYDTNNAIWANWLDGLGYVDENGVSRPGNGTGSEVGDGTTGSYTEESIVNSGSQSMPYWYNNSGSTGKFNYSEAKLSLSAPRDWTKYGVKALSLWFRGYPASVGSFVAEPGGTYTVVGAGEDIWDTSDEFHFAYRTLNGVGSIVARVDSVENVHGWAKAGVMMRDTLDPNSAHAMVVMTPGNGVAFQYRGTAGGISGNDNLAGITAPQWVRLERDIGGNATASYSADGSTWTALGTPLAIPMNMPVYVGLAVTSNIPGVACEAKFSNVATTGNVSVAWTNQDIGISSNAVEPIYVAIANNAGAPAVVYHDDADAAQIDTWTEWNIDLKDFQDQGINLADVNSVAVGLGNRNNPQAGGTGKMYFDDVRLYRPRYVPGKGTPLAADIYSDGVVDFRDFEIVAEDWLLAATAPSDTDIVGWWKLDGSANDSSGNGVHGTLVGDPQWVAGYDGDALDFDGDDHALLGTASDLNFGDATDFSVALWIKTTGWQNDAAIISNKDWDSGSNTGWVIAGEGGGSGSWQWNYSGATGGRADYDPPGPTLSDGQWHHLCVTHDRDGMAKFYVDGAYQDERDISNSTGTIDAGYPTVIGTDGAEGTVWAYWFMGLIDDVRIYDRVLTAAEVPYLAGTRLRADVYEDGKIDLKDYVALADQWLDKQLWPE
ncbi:MAG: LamG domain-containing protein [Phycisphaerales bacterium]|jgi:hypothetical protein